MNQLPPKFVEMVNALGAPWAETLLHALAESDPTVAVRFNRRKAADTSRLLSGFGSSPVPWEPLGIYLDSRPHFTLDPAMHQGLYYVQDPSSMIIGEVIRRLNLDPGRPVAYLDACAAPGGKTTAAIDALPDESCVVANEYDPRRASILAENVAKWGYPATVVTRGDTARFAALPGAFHIVAVDAPCSGEGMMRKDPTAVQQWSQGLVEQCAERQRQIITNLWPSVAPGGYLIYSTCTFNRSENEDILRWMADTFGAIPVDLELPAEWGIQPSLDPALPAYRFIPGVTRGEGLFIAVMQRPDDDSAHTPSRHAKASKNKRSPSPKAPDLTDWLTPPGEFVMSVDPRDASLHAVPARWEPLVRQALDTLNVVDFGINIATPKGRDLIPAQQLAMSTALRLDTFPEAEVDTPTALAYLRREAIALPDGTPRGFTLLLHNGHPLGFAKNLGNRANNLYPATWRILH